jgi:hypothetical protein
MTSSRQKLVQELKAIELWDNFFYLEPAHDKMALVAFQSRQSRRREILKLLNQENRDYRTSLQSSVAEDASLISIPSSQTIRMD